MQKLLHPIPIYLSQHPINSESFPFLTPTRESFQAMHCSIKCRIFDQNSFLHIFTPQSEYTTLFRDLSFSCLLQQLQCLNHLLHNFLFHTPLLHSTSIFSFTKYSILFILLSIHSLICSFSPFLCFSSSSVE